MKPTAQFDRATAEKETKAPQSPYKNINIMLNFKRAMATKIYGYYMRGAADEMICMIFFWCS